MTWSIERACVYAYSSAAVAVQGVLGACGRLEQITRPPRRPFADYDEPLVEGFDCPRCDHDCNVDDDCDCHTCDCHTWVGEPTGTPFQRRPAWVEDYARRLLDPGIGAEPNSPAASAAGDSPAGVEHPPVPPAGIPDDATSNLLLGAAVELDYYLSKYESSLTSCVTGRAFTAKLRARAEVFRRVEDEGHDVGLSWAAETFPQFQKPQK